MSTIDNALTPTLAHLQYMLTWPDGWNSYNAIAPKPEAVSRATTWITEIYQHLQQSWIAPNVTATSCGYVHLSWHYGQRGLFVTIGEQKGEQDIDYLQEWSKGPNSKLTDGEITSIEDMQKLWQWLLEKKHDQETR